MAINYFSHFYGVYDFDLLTYVTHTFTYMYVDNILNTYTYVHISIEWGGGYYFDSVRFRMSRCYESLISEQRLKIDFQSSHNIWNDLNHDEVVLLIRRLFRNFISTKYRVSSLTEGIVEFSRNGSSFSTS